MPRSTLQLAMLMVVVITINGCSAAPRNLDAVHAYYNYDFPSAREALRGDAYLRNDEQVVLNNLRLGLAALADGDATEAERALVQTFNLLSTAGLNADRTTAAVWAHEGVRIWKGEPFEQALAYHWVATLYAVMGDWENARAASTNALFRLTDFGADQNFEQLARNAVEDDAYLEDGYTAVDTNFALGFLMQAIASDLSGTAGAEQQFAAAVEINPELQGMVDVLHARLYDTILIIDYGKGPTKNAYGRDNALVAFDPQDHSDETLVVYANGVESARAQPVCDVNAMAVDHRWNNLEDVRRAKSALGDAMLISGLAVAGGSRKDEHKLLGGGLALAGLLSKSGARADTRYMEFAPASVYVIPLGLSYPSDLEVFIDRENGTYLYLPGVQPGTRELPRAIYLRLHGPDSDAPGWLAAETCAYGNDVTGEFEGDYPWILGGTDVSTPSRDVLLRYQENGYLPDHHLNDLHALYDAEGVLIGSGMENRPDQPRNPSFRHILENGTGLFTPVPDSLGYKRLMFTPRPAYVPKSDLVRNLARQIRVNQLNQQEDQP